MPFKNFKMWRGRLPHWRADDVTYYVEFRHRRELDPAEQTVLFRQLFRTDGKKFELIALGVFEKESQLLFRALNSPKGAAYELSKVVETAKRKAGKAIIDNTGERFPPFWDESYDRIVRDDAELEEKIAALFELASTASPQDDPSDYPRLYLQGEPA